MAVSIQRRLAKRTATTDCTVKRDHLIQIIHPQGINMVRKTAGAKEDIPVLRTHPLHKQTTSHLTQTHKITPYLLVRALLLC